MLDFVILFTYFLNPRPLNVLDSFAVNTLMTQVTSFSSFSEPNIYLPYEQNSGSQQRFFADVRIKLIE